MNIVFKGGGFSPGTQGERAAVPNMEGEKEGDAECARVVRRWGVLAINKQPGGKVQWRNRQFTKAPGCKKEAGED